MKKQLLKFLSCLILGASVLGSAGVSKASACPLCYCGVTVHVSDSDTFCSALANACSDTVIELDDDIYLDGPTNLNSWGVIRKNGHRIMERYTINHPGYYTTDRVVHRISNPPCVIYDCFGEIIGYEDVPDTEVVTYENVWHPSWVETGYREVF